MGFADRDYYREPTRTRVGALQTMSITTWVIAINIGVYILNLMSVRRYALDDPYWFGRLYYWGFFSAEKAWQLHEFWRFLTFQFLHQNLEHIIFNMLALYIFGPIVEEYLGARRYLAFYLLCGIAGAVMYLLLWSVGMLNDGARTPMVGASAGIFGVLLAGAYIAPDATVMLLFPPIPLRLRWLAWILIAIALYTVVESGPNAGGQAAHLGGAALGAILIRRPQWLNWLAPRRKPNSYRSTF